MRVKEKSKNTEELKSSAIEGLATAEKALYELVKETHDAEIGDLHLRVVQLKHQVRISGTTKGSNYGTN